MDNVTIDYIEHGGSRIMVIINNGDVRNLCEWTVAHKDEIEQNLMKYGGILYRNFEVESLEAFENFSKVFTPELEKYKERSTPRSEVKGNVYTSTEYPADQHIAMHNENSYAHIWAEKIFFHCVEPSETGGETPIADSREVYKQLSPELKGKFENKKVLYQRNIGGHLDLPWQEVFQTQSKEEVEAYCSEAGIELQWFDNDKLRTKAVRSAVARHPVTNEYVWFNQAHLFHVSNLSPMIREYLIQSVGEDNLPRNTYYGDGEVIGDDELEEIRQVYEANSIAFPWVKGDILMLDNYLMAHGRRPFTGKRKIVVTMGGLTTNYNLPEAAATAAGE